MKYLFLLAAITAVLSGCSTTDPAGEVEAKLNGLFEKYKTFQFYTYPEYATYNGVHDHNDRLTDQSFEAGQRYTDSITSFHETLMAIDRSQLNEGQKVNYDLFAYLIEDALAEDKFEIGRYLSFNQQNGYHIYFPQIIETQPLETTEDIANYFSRLRAFPQQVDHIIENLRRAKTLDIMLACPISEQVLRQLEGLANMDYTSSTLYTAKEKSKALENESQELADLLENTIIPAYRKLYTFFKDQYQPYCRENVGISSVPGGKEYYEYLTRKHTSTQISPEEVFQTGLTEVERIRDEMLAVKSEMGYAGMELTEFFAHLRTSPEFYYTKKEDLMNGYRAILSKMDKQLPNLFGRLPKTGYDLKEMEAYRAVAAPAAYYYPLPDDGSRPGYFYVNTHQLDARPKYTMTALALHEAVPGHHLQIAIAKELENVPWFRNQMWVTAYGEGWGLYSEFLGYETGMYDAIDQKLGALSFEMWRACRLVVDVGIHYKDWSKADAMVFMRENAPLSEWDINSEIDRYISWPGQALAYKIGELRLKELRTRAESTLGDKFDIKGFHDAILANGNIPLDLLETKIDAWIASRE